jgi:heme/copper-type cytochrome/quinol oxidase subunit 2
MDALWFEKASINSKLWTWLLGGGVVLAILFLPQPSTAAVPATHQIRIEAGNFAYTPGTIQVNPGDQVTIELIATDVVHGLYLDGYDLEVTADPGQTAVLSFTADKRGSFRFRCSVTCGALHPFMIGKLQVGSNNLLWRGIALAMVAAIGGLWGWSGGLKQ